MRSVVRPRSGHTVSPRHALTATLAAGLVLGLAACSGLEPSAPTTGGSGDASGEAAASVDELAIVVPADPGGGWDQTGRAMQQDLQGSGLVRTATVTNVGGAGGTVGLASLANTTDPHTLLVMGLVMVGAVETNESQARIEDTTPIARLTEEPLVVVVPASSPYQTLEDLVDDVVANGKSVSITGGSAGGADHILAGMLLQAADVPSAEVGGLLNYVAYSGGGESLAALLGNKVSAGISGVGEYAEQVKAGTVRALAVSGAERTDLLPDVPTMTEAGYDVELTNWRGVVAPGDLSDEDRAALELLVSEMVASDEWQATLEEKGWDDAFLVGEEFDGFLTENIADIKMTLTDVGLVAP
ncbi:Bug family tripartite tricarboxylate transporter substrate binding protein [Cellulosimicrobium funkei]|uniref:Bug family tripartite tricarboxylate transporter substrate binding protein n=1 Tax=Cellulosimicrobium funkei TaxID=264251 RepID=UPI0030FA0832